MPVNWLAILRSFFTVIPEADTCLAIHRWASLNWPHVGRLVAAQNYHVTLAFLDDITPAQRANMELQLEGIETEPFDLTLDEVGYWPDSKVLWVAPRNPPEPLLKLAQRCSRVANNAGISVSKRRFRPHLTLARRVLDAPPPAMLEEKFSTRIDGFSLCQSIRDSRAVRYIEINGWYC